MRVSRMEDGEERNSRFDGVWIEGRREKRTRRDPALSVLARYLAVQIPWPCREGTSKKELLCLSTLCAALFGGLR